MTDPRRLLEAEGTSLTATLLRAGRNDAPSERLLEDTLLALGAGAAAAGSGVAATALAGGSGVATLKASSSAGLAGLALKWLGLGAVGGALTMSAAVGVEHALGPADQPQAVLPAPPVPAPAPTLAAKEQASPAAEAVPPPPAPPGPAAALPSAEPPKPAPASIAEETAAIDRARRALAGGNAAQALATLDDYDRRPGQHRLEQEALLLRMDALERSGNIAAAKLVARRLLDQSPNGPHAARARQVLGDSGHKK